MLMKKHHASHEFELNLTPIIDCFVTLICFLLLSATYVNLTGMEAKVPIAVPSTSVKNDQKEKFKLELNARVDSMELVATGAGNLSGKKKLTHVTATANGKTETKPNFAALHDELLKYKKAFPKEFSIYFNSETEMKFEDLVRYMDATRNFGPKDEPIQVTDERNGKIIKMDVMFPDFVIANLAATGKGEKSIKTKR